VNGVLERVVENWLTNSSELTFQIPFCHMLHAGGFKVIHLTRHCAMELGKDIIAVSEDGTPHAYQLKGAKGGHVTLAQWRDDIQPQINDLVLGDINHPSVNSEKPHKAFLVVNGYLNEEVSRAIDDYNSHLKKSGFDTKLETILLGELLNKATNLGFDLWPSQLSDVKNFLEIYITDPNKQLLIENYTMLLEKLLFIDEPSDVNISKAQYIRNISAGALLCSSAIASYSNKKNYAIEIQAWTIFLSYIYACAEKYDLEKKDIADTVNIVKETIYDRLFLLCEELKERSHFVEGDALTDTAVYKVRMTYLVALMSTYGLWQKIFPDANYEKKEYEEFLEEFIIKNSKNMELWGEAAIPQFLLYRWYLKTIDPSPAPDFILKKLIEIITKINNPKNKKSTGLANPYYLENDILPIIGDIDDIFIGSSYTLESLTHLFVRRNFMQEMKFLWPKISKLSFNSFEADETWQYYLWRTNSGTNIEKFPPYTKSWTELKDEANECKGDKVPKFMKDDIIFASLFLLYFPHRVYPNFIRWLDNQHKEYNRRI
jgi:hypothetical protein